MAIDGSISSEQGKRPAGLATSLIDRISGKDSKVAKSLDEIANIRTIYQNTLDQQSALMDTFGKQLPKDLESMLTTAVKGFDNILDQGTEVNENEAEATFALAEKIHKAKIGADNIEVLGFLKQLSKKQQIETIGNVNALSKISGFVKVSGQSLSKFVSSNIEGVSNSDVATELAQSLPVALSGPFAPLVSGIDSLVDFSSLGKKATEKVQAISQKIADKRLAKEQRDTDKLVSTIEDSQNLPAEAAEEAAAAIPAETVDRTDDQVQAINAVNDAIREQGQDMFFSTNTQIDGQNARHAEQMEMMQSMHDTEEAQLDALGELEEGRDSPSKLKALSGPLGGLLGGLGKGVGKSLALLATGFSAIKGVLGKGLVIAGLFHFVDSFKKGIDDIMALDPAQIEANGGFVQAAIVAVMDRVTFGLTSTLSDKLSMFIRDDLPAMLEGLAEIGSDMKDWAVALYEDNMKEPLEAISESIVGWVNDTIVTPFTQLGELLATWFDEYVQTPFEEGFAAISEGIDSIIPDFLKPESEEEESQTALIGKLEESGAVDKATPGTSMFGNKDTLDFTKLNDQKLSSSELQGLSKNLDLDEGQSGTLAGLIKRQKLNEETISKETVKAPPQPAANPIDKLVSVMDAKMAEINKALEKAGGPTVAITSGGGDDLGLHNEDRALDMANMSAT